MPLSGEQRIAADDQPLAGKLLAGNLGEVAFVEQRWRDGSGGDQLADGRRAQRRDPAQPVDVGEVLADAGRGQHPAVTDEHHAVEAEAGADLVDLRGDGVGVAGRALEDLDGDRTPGGRAEQTEDDLERALLAVAAVAAPGEFAVGSLDVAGGQVVEHQGVFLEMALGETLLDGRLTLDEPVHRGVQLLGVDGAEVEHFPRVETALSGFRARAGGQLRLRVDDAGDEQCEDEVAEASGASGEQGGDCELADGGEHGGDVAVGEAAEAGEGVVGADESLAAEDAAQGVDGGGGELGEVGEGSLLDAAAVAEGLSEEDGGRRGAVGNALDIHGYYCTAIYQILQGINHLRSLPLHGYISPDKSRQEPRKAFGIYGFRTNGR